MNSIEAIAEVIQLAVAPVFLLAGIAGLLGVPQEDREEVYRKIRAPASGRDLFSEFIIDPS